MPTENQHSPRRVLIIVPYKARDLDGLALVGYILRNKYGHDVMYSNGYDIEAKLLNYAPDALVLDHLVWDFKARQARLARQLGMKVLVLPTEGFHQDVEDGLRIAGKLTGVSWEPDCHFAWGDFVRNAVLAANLTSEDRIHTIGCPRFDFYSEPYIALMKKRSEFLGQLGIRNSEAPVILWASSTTYVARHQRKIIRRQVGRGKLPKQEVLSTLSDEHIQFHGHSETVLELARRHPDWNFVVKTHPAEWVNPYVSLVEKSPNLYLAFNAPIRDFLYNCDVLLQRNCTTATEAWMLGKPVLELEIGKFSMTTRPEYMAGNEVVTTIDEADDALIKYISGAPITDSQLEAREAFIADSYYRNDGRSSERCAMIIDQVVSAPGYTDQDQAATRNAAGEALAAWKRDRDSKLSTRMKDLLGIDRDVSLRFWKKFIQREEADNLGLFTAEIDITPDMVDDVYRVYDELLRTVQVR